jgi:hypothetical protein
MTAPPQAVERRRRKWPLFLVIAISVGALGAVHSPLMAIDEVEVLGANRADVAGVVEGLGVGPGALLLWIDTGSIESAVRSEPWIADVRVDRILPNRLVVEVIEHQPVLWIEGVLNWMLVARDGTVLDVATEPTAGLLRAALAFPDRDPGDQPVDPLWGEVVEMALVLADDLGGTITLEMRGSEMWTAVFGHEVRLGFPIDLADKARTLRAMFSDDIPDGAVVDVSSPLRPAVVPAEIQEDVEPSDGQG